MSLDFNAVGAINAVTGKLEDRIIVLEEKNQQLEERLRVLSERFGGLEAQVHRMPGGSSGGGYSFPDERG